MPGALTITVAEAARRLGFPKATTERVARDLGLLILAGNRKRIDPNDLSEIMDTCRNAPRDRASTSGRIPAFGSSATPAAASVQQALATAEMLKRPSPSTSPSGTARVAQIRRMA